MNTNGSREITREFIEIAKKEISAAIKEAFARMDKSEEATFAELGKSIKATTARLDEPAEATIAKSGKRKKNPLKKLNREFKETRRAVARNSELINNLFPLPTVRSNAARPYRNPSYYDPHIDPCHGGYHSGRVFRSALRR